MNFDLNTILLALFFGLMGMASWGYGRRMASARHMYLGIGLMVFPYFVGNFWVVLLIGTCLVLLLFWP